MGQTRLIVLHSTTPHFGQARHQPSHRPASGAGAESPFLKPQIVAPKLRPRTSCKPCRPMMCGVVVASRIGCVATTTGASASSASAGSARSLIRDVRRGDRHRAQRAGTRVPRHSNDPVAYFRGSAGRNETVDAYRWTPREYVCGTQYPVSPLRPRRSTEVFERALTV